VIIPSNGANDGWVLESGENTNVGGTLNATDTTFNLGDDALNKQYRGILHFDTSGLPDNAVITSATLKIQKQGLVGVNPFTTHGSLLADVRKPFFGTSAALQVGDFQAAPGSPAVAAFGAAPVGAWYSAVLNNAGKANINLGGTTQFRLRFVKDDDNDHIADYVKFYSGNAPAANRPQLVITYTLAGPTSTPTITPTFAPTPTLVPFTGASYVYDGDGNMVKSTINNVTTYYANRLYQVTNGVATKYYGSYAMRVGSTLYYLLSDQLGSTSITLNASGKVVAELRYTAFGEVRYALGDTPTDHRYTGQRQQRDLGLYYYGARWYDPVLGRFAQADTVVPNAGSSQAWDRYAYVSNNPVNFADPSGHSQCDYIPGPAHDACSKSIGEPTQSNNFVPPPPDGPPLTTDCSLTEWNGYCVTGSQMKDLYGWYSEHPGQWNNQKTSSFSPQDFLAWMIAMEIGYTLKDDKTLGYAKTLAAEKMMWLCERVSGNTCSSLNNDNAIFNYVATRASAGFRYTVYSAGGEPDPHFDNWFDAGYISKAKEVASYATAYTGTGSLADWGNLSMFHKQTTRDALTVATQGEAENQYLAMYSGPDPLYFLNRYQNYYWYRLDR
jgi:RHS repeat-associated protein